MIGCLDALRIGGRIGRIGSIRRMGGSRGLLGSGPAEDGRDWWDGGKSMDIKENRGKLVRIDDKSMKISEHLWNSMKTQRDSMEINETLMTINVKSMNVDENR